MRILLVYPEFPDTFWSFKHALKFVSKRACLPPLGLLTVAAMLPAEWEQRLVDMNVRRLTDKDLAWADYVLMSAMVVQRDSALQVAARCHALGKPVVAGGPLFTEEPEKFPTALSLVLNEAEITLPRFLADLAAGHPEHIYTADGYADIRQSPPPRWDLADLRRYSAINIQFSRGCPFNCEFCNITSLFGHTPRTKTAAQLITELDMIYRLGWRGDIFFVDDNLIGNKRLLKSEILPALIQWGALERGITFQTEVSINLADDDELLESMVRAGFSTVFIGIETPDEEALAECNKMQNKGRDLTACVIKLQKAGLQVQGGFIVGFDSDTTSIFRRQIDFIQKSGIVTAMVGLLQAPRGTQLYDRLQREGRLLTDFTGDNTGGSINFVPRMDTETLFEGYKSIVREIYDPKVYYARVRTFLQRYNPARFTRPITWIDVVALFRSIFRLGIKGRERVEYWKLFFWTLFRRPKLFPLAITFSIYGFHFRTVSELVETGVLS